MPFWKLTAVRRDAWSFVILTSKAKMKTAKHKLEILLLMTRFPHFISQKENP